MRDNKRFNEVLGNCIKKARINKEMTQLDVAILMQMDYQNISRIERGKTTPSFYWIIEFCACLRIDPGTFTDDFFKELHK